MTAVQPTTSYETEILAWRQEMENKLRAENGWLTLAGLFWLEDGEHTVGSDPASAIPLPPGSAPERLGLLRYRDGRVYLHILTDETVTIEGKPSRGAWLRDDNDEDGPSLVSSGSITFFVIRRGNQYGIRVRDRNSLNRQTFSGRRWFVIDPAYRIQGKFIPRTPPRQMEVVNVVGILEMMENPGVVEFTLHGHDCRLEAFKNDDGKLWFVFKDATNGSQTYPTGRFLVATLESDGTVILDFNRAYNPPCAFTPYATCPLPPPGNSLSVPIEAGEKTSDKH